MEDDRKKPRPLHVKKSREATKSAHHPIFGDIEVIPALKVIEG